VIAQYRLPSTGCPVRAAQYLLRVSDWLFGAQGPRDCKNMPRLKPENRFLLLAGSKWIRFGALVFLNATHQNPPLVFVFSRWRKPQFLSSRQRIGLFNAS
jgi:hypothetical protein